MPVLLCHKLELKDNEPIFHFLSEKRNMARSAARQRLPFVLPTADHEASADTSVAAADTLLPKLHRGDSPSSGPFVFGGKNTLDTQVNPGQLSWAIQLLEYQTY